VAKPNYSFEKRQRELAKKKKKEEKLQRKAGPAPRDQPDDGQGPVDAAPAPVVPGAGRP